MNTKAEQQKLFKKCFSQENLGLKNMIRVCEKIKWKGRQLQEQQQKVLKRV
jgi:hypothetical protein